MYTHREDNSASGKRKSKPAKTGANGKRGETRRKKTKNKLSVQTIVE